MQKWMASAAGNGAELVLFTELNISGTITAPIAYQLAEPIPRPSTETIISLAKQNSLTVGFGSIEQAGDEYYCTHVLVSGSGITGKQRKIHVPAHEQPYRQAGITLISERFQQSSPSPG